MNGLKKGWPTHQAWPLFVNNVPIPTQPQPLLMLKPRRSRFDGLVLREIVDERKLSVLIKKRGDGPRAPLSKFNATMKDGVAVIRYTKSVVGRAVSKTGLHGMEKKYRYYFARNLYKDIDMDNAQPVINLGVCDTYGIPCFALRKYVRNREKYLNSVASTYGVSRGDAKALFLRLMFGGHFKGWALKHGKTEGPTKFITQFMNEMTEVSLKIMRYNPAIVKDARERKRTARAISRINKRMGLAEWKKKRMIDDQLRRSTMALFLQEYESRVLETIFNYCEKEGLIKNNIAVLCNDGIMLPRENVIDESSVLAQFTLVVKEEHGLDLKFSIKPMPEISEDDLMTSVPSLSTLTLKSMEMNLDNATVYEPVDYLKMRKMMDSKLNIKKETRQNMVTYLKRAAVKRNGCEFVPLKFVMNKLFGRMHTKGISIQDFEASVKHTLIGKNYRDIDLRNAGFDLLYNVIVLHPEELGPIENYPMIKKYHDERDAMLDMIRSKHPGATKEVAKNVFIALMYHGAKPDWLHDMIELDDLQTEIIRATDIIMKYNPDIVQSARQSLEEKGGNVKGTFLSLYIGELERRVICYVYDYLKKEEYLIDDVFIYSYDGCIISADRFHDRLCDELSAEILRRMNFVVKFVEKPMNEGFTEAQLNEYYTKMLSDREIMAERANPRVIHKWIPDTKILVRFINNHAFFKDKMMVDDQNGTLFTMKPVDDKKWKCPLRDDCSGKGNIFTTVTDTGLFYYCNSEECCKRDDDGKRISSYQYHSFDAFDKCNGLSYAHNHKPHAIDSETINELIEGSFMSDMMKTMDKSDADGDVYYDTSGLRPLDRLKMSTKRNTICIKAPCGDGKSKMIGRKLDELEKEKGVPFTVISCTNRKTLAGEQSTKYRLDGCDAVQGPLRGERMVLQLEVLHRLEIRGGIDVLILDEPVGLLEQMQSKFFNKGCWDKFKYIVKKAKNVIVADANLTREVVELIQMFRSDSKLILNTNCVQKDRNMRIYHTESIKIITARMLYLIRKKKRIVIVSNSKKVIDMYHRIIINLKEVDPSKIGIYTSDTPDNTKKKHFSNVNEVFDDYIILEFSPTLTAGVSYEGDNFDEMFCVFVSCSTTAASSFQMLKRVRNIKSGRIHICFHKCRVQSLPVEPSDIDDYIKRSFSVFQKEYDQNNILCTRMDDDDMGKLREIKRDKFYQIMRWLIKHTNESRNNFVKEFMRIGIENQGWMLERIFVMGDAYCQHYDIQNKALEEVSSAMKLAKNQLKGTQYNEVMLANGLDQKELQLLEDKKNDNQFLTRVENDRLENMIFLNSYNVTKIRAKLTCNFYNMYWPYKTRHIYKNLCEVSEHGYSRKKVDMHVKSNAQKEYKNNDVVDENFAFSILTDNSKHLPDKISFALQIVESAGFKDIFDSPNYGSSSMIAIEIVETNMIALFRGFWTGLCISIREQDVSNFRHNVNYMRMIYNLQHYKLNDLTMDSIDVILVMELANSILTIMYGVSFSKIQKKYYVLKHKYPFHHPHLGSVFKENKMPVEIRPYLKVSGDNQILPDRIKHTLISNELFYQCIQDKIPDAMKIWRENNEKRKQKMNEKKTPKLKKNGEPRKASRIKPINVDEIVLRKCFNQLYEKYVSMNNVDHGSFERQQTSDVGDTYSYKRRIFGLMRDFLMKKTSDNMIEEMKNTPNEPLVTLADQLEYERIEKLAREEWDEKLKSRLKSKKKMDKENKRNKKQVTAYYNHEEDTLINVEPVVMKNKEQSRSEKLAEIEYRRRQMEEAVTKRQEMAEEYRREKINKFKEERDKKRKTYSDDMLVNNDHKRQKND